MGRDGQGRRDSKLSFPHESVYIRREMAFCSWSPPGKLSSDFMTLSMSKYEEPGTPRCGASQVPGDDVGARDKVTRRVTLQPVHASSSALIDAPHRSVPSSSPDLDCKVMKSFDSFPDGLLGNARISTLIHVIDRA